MGLLDPAGSTAKFPTPGTSVCGVVEAVTERHATEFGTGKPKYWPSGDPVIEHVITLRQDDDERAVIYAKPEQQRAIRKAVTMSGAHSFETGARLTLTYVGDDPASKAAIKKKLYEATYEAPAETE